MKFICNSDLCSIYLNCDCGSNCCKGHKIEDGLVELDEKLALAIKAVVEKIPGLGDHEPINPIQMAIGQLIANMQQQKLQPEMKVIERDEKGLFTSQDS